MRSTPRPAYRSSRRRRDRARPRLLEVLALLCHRPRHLANMSTAYMFRTVEAACPTLLIDEADTIFTPGDKSHEDLRGLINAGHRRGATVGRMVGEGSMGSAGLCGVLPDRVGRDRTTP